MRMGMIFIPAYRTGDGYPMVGWLVPLEGPQRGQTFKLMMDTSTTIGRDAAAAVQIEDERVEDLHCRIESMPTGFVLHDGGSKAGTYINERRIDRHELVDNDVITIGRTPIKFKSIN